MLLRLLLRRRPILLAGMALLLIGCTVVSVAHRTPEFERADQVVDVPARAHLHDGRTLLYRDGFRLLRDTLVGTAIVYDMRLEAVGAVERMPLSEVAAVEAIHRTTNAGASFVLTLLGIAVGGVALAGLAVAVFGSCPTFYAVDAGAFVLEAEGFSYSISPLLESRDVDLLGLRADADGKVVLEVRNEALETHFINHVEVLEVRHAAGERVVPDTRGQPLVLAGLQPFAVATDRSGRDVRAMLARQDSIAYETPRSIIEAATETDLEDWIELAAPRPPGDSVAIALRMRNSLLTTILLYDYMLAAQGARALNWVGRDIEVIENALELANWYTKRMGMRVAVQEDGEWREVGRVPATGPIAWETIAFMVPVPPGDSLRVRLSFATDEWRIDEVGFATARAGLARVLPLARAVDAHGIDRPDIVEQLAEPDQRYLETRPGTRFTVYFAAGHEPADGARTFLLASQGYYVEWIRADWMRSGRRTIERFTPGDRVLLDALRSWNAVRDRFEAEFYDSRIPVR